MWHASAVSLHPSDVILAQLACPLSDVMFYLQSGITNLYIYKHWNALTFIMLKFSMAPWVIGLYTFCNIAKLIKVQHRFIPGTGSYSFSIWDGLGFVKSF